jgi:outer membrane murein-binding lipoprotein Lpp
MNKKMLGALVIIALLTVACASGTGTGDGTGTDATDVVDVAAQVEALQTQLTQFASEIEASAPDSVQSAFTDVQDELAGLLPAASDLSLSAEEVAPVTEAAEEFSQALTDGGVELSDEFMDFWSRFSSRIADLAA